MLVSQLPSDAHSEGPKLTDSADDTVPSTSSDEAALSHDSGLNAANIEGRIPHTLAYSESDSKGAENQEANSSPKPQAVDDRNKETESFLPSFQSAKGDQWAKLHDGLEGSAYLGGGVLVPQLPLNSILQLGAGTTGNGLSMAAAVFPSAAAGLAPSINEWGLNRADIMNPDLGSNGGGGLPPTVPAGLSAELMAAAGGAFKLSLGESQQDNVSAPDLPVAGINSFQGLSNENDKDTTKMSAKSEQEDADNDEDDDDGDGDGDLDGSEKSTGGADRSNDGTDDSKVKPESDNCDEASDSATKSSDANSASGGKEPPFPVKLHRILSNPEYSDLITWLPHGRSWRVLKPKAFEERVIPLFFRHAKYASFMRQVNGWGFKRMTQGPDHNSYYHELFLRGLPQLCAKMKRPAKAKQGSSDSENNPDFYKMSMISPLPTSATAPGAAELSQQILAARHAAGGAPFAGGSAMGAGGGFGGVGGGQFGMQGPILGLQMQHRAQMGAGPEGAFNDLFHQQIHSLQSQLGTGTGPGGRSPNPNFFGNLDRTTLPGSGIMDSSSAALLGSAGAGVGGAFAPYGGFQEAMLRQQQQEEQRRHSLSMLSDPSLKQDGGVNARYGPSADSILSGGTGGADYPGANLQLLQEQQQQQLIEHRMHLLQQQQQRGGPGSSGLSLLSGLGRGAARGPQDGTFGDPYAPGGQPDFS